MAPRRVALLVLAAGLSASARAAPKVDWPDGAEAESVAKFANLPFALRKKVFKLGLDQSGRPVLQTEDMFIPLKLHKEEPAPTPFQPKGLKVDSFAFLANGMVLVVSGDSLMVPTDKGVRTILNLPYRGMKVAPYGGGGALIYGGKAVYLFYPERPAQAATIYLNVPGGVDALAAGADYAVVASGRSIFLYKPGKPPAKLTDLEAPVRSLALNPSGGIFFATDDEAFFSSSSGRFRFSRHPGSLVAAAGDTLYVLFPGEGVMKCRPTSLFEMKARSLDKPAKKR